MNRETLNKQVIRHLIFSVVKNVPNLQFASMAGYVSMEAVNSGVLEGSPNVINEGLLLEDEKKIVNEIVWDLLTQGVLVPGASSGGAEFPFFRLTDYGRKCVDEDAILPHDYENYLQNVKTILKVTDDIFMLYLEESVQAFLKGLYISTTVNLGVATERLVEILLEEYTTSLASGTEKLKFQNAVAKAKHPAAQFEEVYKRLEQHRRDMPSKLGNNLNILKFIQEIIRTERNDAGHPSGRRFTRDEAMTYLLTFPSYLKIYKQVISWIKSQNSHA